ncbi:MAG: hypothetical protein ACRCY9_10455 [Phycicoccus sp.]
MLLTFVVRRVLRAGVLRSRAVRWVAGAAAVAVLLTLVAAGHLFFRDQGLDQATWRLLLDIATVSLLFWVGGAVIFVKVLFLNSGSMMEFTFHLPVTARERAVALLVYEATVAAVVVAVGALSLSVNAVLVGGVGLVDDLLTATVLPCLVLFLVLNISALALERLLRAARAGAVAQILTVVVLFVGMLLYSGSMTGTIGHLSEGVVKKHGRPWLTFSAAPGNPSTMPRTRASSGSSSRNRSGCAIRSP